MVLESVVADLLNRFLGDYVENLNKSQLKLGIWGGKEPLLPPRIRGAAGPPLSPGAGASSRRGGERVSLAGVPRQGVAGCGTAVPSEGRSVCGFAAPCEERASCGAAALREGRSVSLWPRT